MIGSVWRFIKRHKKKIFFTGAVVGGVVLLGHYARNKLKEFQDHEAAEYLARVRKEHHFENNLRTCNTTAVSMIPQLREAITKQLHTEELTELLKTKPENKLDIWAELKVKSFTRMFVSVYASSMLVAVLRVRLNIIGGYMFVDSMRNRNGLSESVPVATEDIQRDYLQEVQYVMGKGLQDLVSAVLKVTEIVIKDIDLRERLSPRDLDDLVRRVRHQMELQQENGYCEAGTSALCRFMMRHYSGEIQGAACREEVILEKLNRETQDILENSDFAAVLSLSLDRMFSLVVDHLCQHFNQQSSIGPDVTHTERCEDPTLPMAKLIPLMDGMVRVVLADMPNQFIREQLLMEQGKDFAANVYEAFSHVDLT